MLQRQLEEESVVLIDVRTLEENNDLGSIPGSVNIPVDQVAEAFSYLTDQQFRDRYGISKPAKNAENVVVSCSGGYRSASARQLLVALGWPHIILYPGSFDDWVA